MSKELKIQFQKGPGQLEASLCNPLCPREFILNKDHVGKGETATGSHKGWLQLPK